MSVILEKNILCVQLVILGKKSVFHLPLIITARIWISGGFSSFLFTSHKLYNLVSSMFIQLEKKAKNVRHLKAKVKEYD